MATNYVVVSPSWDCTIAAGCSGTIVNVGAITWRTGTAASTGVIDTSNSLVGSSASDQIGISGALALTNGNYVVFSALWNCTVAAGCSGTIADTGAATWRSGSSAGPGVITTANSLVGSTASDNVGYKGRALTNGNFVLVHKGWDCTVAAGCSSNIVDVGAVTWGSGTTGVVGAVNTSNSLVGSSAGDTVGYDGFATDLRALANGNYLVGSAQWDCAILAGCSGSVSDVGAVTWGSGTSGVSGSVSTLNSVVGSSTGDKLGDSITVLNSGNYLVQSTTWNSDEGMIYIAPPSFSVSGIL